MNIRVVVAYRPVLNKSGSLSVWNQQKSFFEGIKDDRCPRELFIEDLCREVTQWLESGNQLVVKLDVNDDVRNCKFTEMMGQLGLVELVTAQHGVEGPSTYNRGSQPIDGLFVSRTLRGL